MVAEAAGATLDAVVALPAVRAALVGALGTCLRGRGGGGRGGGGRVGSGRCGTEQRRPEQLAEHAASCKFLQLVSGFVFCTGFLVSATPVIKKIFFCFGLVFL